MPPEPWKHHVYFNININVHITNFEYGGRADEIREDEIPEYKTREHEIVER